MYGAQQVVLLSGASRELVVNPGPGFSTTTAWSPQTNTPTLSIVANRLRTTPGSASAPARMSTPIERLVIGRAYRVSYSIGASVDPNVNILISVNANLNSAVLSIGSFMGSAAVGIATFVATAATMYAGVSFGAPAGTGEFVDLDYLSIKRLTG